MTSIDLVKKDVLLYRSILLVLFAINTSGLLAAALEKTDNFRVRLRTRGDSVSGSSSVSSRAVSVSSDTSSSGVAVAAEVVAASGHDHTVRTKAARCRHSIRSSSGSGSSTELELSELHKVPKLATKLASADEKDCVLEFFSKLPSDSDILQTLARNNTIGKNKTRATTPERLRKLQEYVDIYQHKKQKFPFQRPYDGGFGIYAAHTNQPAALALLSAVEDLERADKVGRTPLSVAATQGHCETISELLILGINVTPEALTAAVEHGHILALRLLLAKVVTDDPTLPVLLPKLISQAERSGYKEIVETLKAV